LTIPGNIILEDQDGLVFIVNGSIYVDGSITDLSGVFISSDTFFVRDSPPSKPLTVKGMVYSSKISVERIYVDLLKPTYKFIYQPSYLIDLIPYLGRSQVSWQEVSP
jgi:hypothetical protein